MICLPFHLLRTLGFDFLLLPIINKASMNIEHLCTVLSMDTCLLQFVYIVNYIN